MVKSEGARGEMYRYVAQDGSFWVVREAAPGDLDDLAALDDITKPVPWGKDAIAPYIGRVPGVYVLCPANGGGAKLGVPVGFIVAQRLADECEIMSIGVHPDYRRRGFGRMLLDSAAKTALAYGMTSWILEVREHNTAALALYRSFGFVEVGRRRGYYTDTGEAALLMRAALAD